MIVSFGMYWQAYGRQTAEVSDGLTEEEVIKYLKDNWNSIDLPEGDYIIGSDELDEESIDLT